jgi:hypothetical protein
MVMKHLSYFKFEVVQPEKVSTRQVSGEMKSHREKPATREEKEIIVVS